MIPGAVAEFLRRIDVLFFKGDVLRTEGYTKIMIDFLAQANYTVVIDKVPINVGGGQPSRGVLDSCLQRMQAWCRLARAVCRAEFPEFELTSAYKVFNLHADSTVTLAPLVDLTSTTESPTSKMEMSKVPPPKS